MLVLVFVCWCGCVWQNHVLNTIHYVAVLIFIIDQLLMFVVMATPAPLRWLFYGCFAVSFTAFRRCYRLEQRAGFDWEGTSDGATRKVNHHTSRAASWHPSLHLHSTARRHRILSGSYTIEGT